MSNSTESSNRKEKILEKSRQAGIDEGVEYAELRGHRLAANLAFIIAGMPVIIYSILIGERLTAVGITIFIEAYYACLSAMAYRLSKKTKYLFYTVMCTVFFLLCVFLFVRLAMGLSAIPGLG